ncbi:phosphatidylinositol 3,4,5-trisphosphate 3-phosphatase TPTE2 [Eulemur rufifrons]|uniref:phosphatidylinositol 3,4,5-trisphosphate 3-phosphatase TPTE2 n=1 Tax=Eulemur rufifrons TaxID=859984 RepID=UPI003743B467
MNKKGTLVPELGIWPETPLQLTQGFSEQHPESPSALETQKDEQLDGVENDDEHDSDLNKSDRGKIKKIVHSILSSVVFRIFIVLLIFLDISLVIIDLVFTDKIYIPLGYRPISLVIASLFFLDLLLQVYVEGTRHYFSDVLNILDAIIIVVILLFDIIYIFYNIQFVGDIPRLVVLLRLLRLIIMIRLFHLARQKKHLEQLTRRMISGNKRRYTHGGFDLDLTYVTDRIIAMSFPSSGKQSLYRNPITEVVRFLDSKHQNHYQVYNLCSEKEYDPKYFHNRVYRVMIDDHNVPTLCQMVAFSKDVDEWMSKDKENVVVIHCKGGKGRTGTMVCVCLIARGIFLTAQDSLHYFGERRTDKTSSTKFQGVETPSQNRYVRYFEEVKHIYHWNLPPRKLLLLKKLIIYSIHGLGSGNGCDLTMQMIMKQKIVYSCSSSKNARIFHDSESNRVIIYIFSCPPLYDDVKMRFFICSGVPKYHNKCQFFFWFHTSFIRNSRLYLPRNELDKLHKPKTWKIYQPDFAVEIYFEEIII